MSASNKKTSVSSPKISLAKCIKPHRSKRHGANSQRPRRSSLGDCSPISSVLSSTRSLFSKSIERLFGSSTHSSRRTSYESGPLSDNSFPNKTSDTNNRPITARSRSASNSSSDIVNEFHTQIVTAQVHKSQDSPRQELETKKVPVNSKSGGISVVLNSPIKKNLLKSKPVISSQTQRSKSLISDIARSTPVNSSLGLDEPKLDLRRYQPHENPKCGELDGEYLNNQGFNSPPSPAPKSPVKQPTNSVTHNHIYINPLFLHFNESEATSSYHHPEDNSQSSRQFIFSSGNDIIDEIEKRTALLKELVYNKYKSDDDKTHKRYENPNPEKGDPVKELSALRNEERVSSTLRSEDNTSKNYPKNEQHFFVYPVQIHVQPFIKTAQTELKLVEDSLSPGEYSHILPKTSRREYRTPSAYHHYIPEDQAVPQWPTIKIFNRETYKYKCIQEAIALNSPQLSKSELRIFELPDAYFKRPIKERFLEKYPKHIPQTGPKKHSFLTDKWIYRYYDELIMNALEEHERKVIIEFCHLLEKSKQLFNGLRELPQYGHKQWHSYFGRTFDAYTKIWKYQQQHRAVLDKKYGLKRWQIGEIASKIGQLYYHFYLRTSEMAYLSEAYAFYHAIRGRSYYTKASNQDRCELMVKKLRYYARFIVVCLLLRKFKLVRELVKELDRQIVEYGNTYDPDDQVEWSVVVDEVKAFIQHEPVVSVVHPDTYFMILSYRLNPLRTPSLERSPQMTLTLQEVLIIGSNSQQVKFSELTIDMYRMLQTVEREPIGDPQYMYDDSPRQRFIATPSAHHFKGYNLENAPRGDNPHKYLLFKPSPSQILVYLASGCNDLPQNGALLLYISAEGQNNQPKHTGQEDAAYDVGGLVTGSKADIYKDANKDPKNSKNKEPHCLHPGDLYPFTRRPLFVIIDSDSSYIFQNIPRHFGQPLVVFMSPLEIPSSLYVSSGDRRQQGNIFTLFLHSPLSGICFVCDLDTVSLVHWDRAQTYVDTFLTEALQIVTRSRIDPTYISFLGDDFLRVLLLRFIFCEVTLRLHRAFRARVHLPRASPPVPEDILEHPALAHIVLDLANHLQIRGHFLDPAGSGPQASKE